MKKFFLTRSEKYFITEDNWKTFELSNDVPNSGYKKETNSTKKKSIQFKYEFGVKNAKIFIDQFNKIEKILINTGRYRKIDFNDGYGAAFEVFTISALHNIPYEETIENFIVHGSNDAKIDGVYFDELNNECYVYQVKLGFLNSENAQITVDNFQSYLSQGPLSSANSSDFNSFMDQYKYKSQLDSLDKIRYVIISNPVVSVNAEYYSQYKPNQIFEKYIQNLLTPPKDHSIKLKINISRDKVSKISDTEFFTYIQAITLINSLKEASRIDERFHFLFRDNVRGKLTKSKHILKTIQESPELFSKYNNGVSITGKVRFNGTYIYVTNPSIVNGQQTIYTLKDEENLNDIFVPVFFKGTRDEIEKFNIAFYNNSQKAIKPVDLLSINKDLRKLQLQLLSIPQNPNESYFLDIYSQGSTEYKKNAKKIIDKNRIINLSMFLKLYYSIDKPEDIGLWKNTFTKKLTEYMERGLYFDLEKAKLTCHVISRYNKYINSIEDKNERNTIKTGNLAYMYLLYKKENDIVKSRELFNRIIQNGNGKKPNDIFRAKNIINEINAVLDL